MYCMCLRRHTQPIVKKKGSRLRNRSRSIRRSVYFSFSSYFIFNLFCTVESDSRRIARCRSVIGDRLCLFSSSRLSFFFCARLHGDTHFARTRGESYFRSNAANFFFFRQRLIRSPPKLKQWKAFDRIDFSLEKSQKEPRDRLGASSSLLYSRFKKKKEEEKKEDRKRRSECFLPGKIYLASAGFEASKRFLERRHRARIWASDASGTPVRRWKLPAASRARKTRAAARGEKEKGRTRLRVCPLRACSLHT